MLHRALFSKIFSATPNAHGLVADLYGAGTIRGVVATLLCIALVVIVLATLLVIARWKIFVKAGQPGWVSLVPFYSKAKTLEITKLPLWWMLWMAVPILNIVFAIRMQRRLAASFGKGAWFTVGLILLPCIFYPILAFGSSSYANTRPPAMPMSETAKWAWIGYGIAVGWILLEFVCIGIGSSNSKAPLALINGSAYATDGTYVYYDSQLVSGADPSTFVLDGADYATDAHAAYYDGQAIAGADPATFEVLNADYAKDASNVYSDGEGIPGADPQTFHLLDPNDGYAVDRNQAYFDVDVLEGVDKASFVYLGQGYAKDATHVYYEGSVVSGADSSTFVIVMSRANYDARDKAHTYSGGEIYQ